VSSSPWRRAVKRVLRGFGYDVIQYRPSSSDAAKLTALMRHAGVDLVLDVGANEGQFAQELRDGGYRGRIVSFEPLRDAHAKLARAAAGDSAWTVHERCAIGDHDGEVEIHVAGNSVSSSIRPMLEQHAQSAPESRYVGTERVPLRRLKSAAVPRPKRLRWPPALSKWWPQIQNRCLWWIPRPPTPQNNVPRPSVRPKSVRRLPAVPKTNGLAIWTTVAAKPWPKPPTSAP